MDKMMRDKEMKKKKKKMMNNKNYSKDEVMMARGMIGK